MRQVKVACAERCGALVEVSEGFRGPMLCADCWARAKATAVWVVGAADRWETVGEEEGLRLAASGHKWALRVLLGTAPIGLEWAALGCWRVVGYAMGGHSRQVWREGAGYGPLREGERMPADVEAALCCALGLNTEG